MNTYDTTWLAELQAQRRKEAATELTRYPYYLITDYTNTEIPYGYSPDADPDDTQVGDGIVVTSWDDEFFPDTPAGRARLFKELYDDGYEIEGYTEDHEPYPTVDDSITTIAEFYPDLEYTEVARAWQPKPRTELTFLTREEAEQYLTRHRDRLEAPQRAHTTGEAAYRAESMVRLLHLIENIDLERSTIVLKDDATDPIGGF